MEHQQDIEKEIFSKMARLCSRSEECTPDIRKKIRELGGTSLMEEIIIQRLQEEKYIDDDRFVRAYVRDKFRLNQWGRIKMRYYLKMKGLKDNIIEKGFEEIDEEQYVKLLKKTMKDKAKTIKKKEKFEKMAQVIRFAQGRGFEPELIHRYLNESLS
ncbi:MAG: regulatory protein RecX [Bacteroidota bacterium]